MHAASQQYQTLSIASRVEAASPHELVSILYEELVRALDVGRAALLQNKPDAARVGKERAWSILLALDASLDLERGGQLARSLASIYRSMQNELLVGFKAGDPDRIHTLRRSAADLLHAWAQIGGHPAA